MREDRGDPKHVDVMWEFPSLGGAGETLDVMWEFPSLGGARGGPPVRRKGEAISIFD